MSQNTVKTQLNNKYCLWIEYGFLFHVFFYNVITWNRILFKGNNINYCPPFIKFHQVKDITIKSYSDQLCFIEAFYQCYWELW